MSELSRFRPLAVAVLLAAAIPARAWGQGWLVDLSAGGVSHETVGSNVANSAMLGVRHEGPRWLYLYLGAPIDSGGLPWTAAGGGARVEAARGLRSLGADLSAQAYGYRDRRLSETGTGVTVELLPFVGLNAGPARLELHTGGRLYAGSSGDSTFNRPVLDNGALVSYAAANGLGLAAGARLVTASEGSFPHLQARADLSRSRGTLWASAGRWLSESLPTTGWGVGGAVSVADRLQLELSVLQDESDPLYWNPPRRTWSIGVARPLSRRQVSGTALPVIQPSGGPVIIRLPRAAAEAPSIGGDFNDWKPTPMVLSGDEWVATLPLRSGVYHYAFRASDGDWFVPASVPGRVDDGFGGHSAVLIVP
ncbi:MAG: glycogen-binding domain-containing protein [Gemmatimonadetes bacterium]|nr:glycogen-binding domain-containing protein [Gemmatimonadota bacterium]